MKNYKEIITTIIKELGVSANVSGFYYIRCAVELIINDAGLIKSISKGLYPLVAKQFDTTASRVERAIRHAVESGWSRANIDFTKELFGYSVDAYKGNPTNSEFLATVADYVVVKYGGEADA